MKWLSKNKILSSIAQNSAYKGYKGAQTSVLGKNSWHVCNEGDSFAKVYIQFVHTDKTGAELVNKKNMV